MNRNFLTLILTITICTVIGLLQTSCSSKEVPSGFLQKLVNFHVKLLHEGKPVQNAAIVLVAETPSGYNVLGITDLSGIAKPKTAINTYSRAGIPTTIYQVIVTHIPKAPSELANSALGKMSNAEIDAYREKIKAEIAAIPHPVPKEWGDLKTTPVKITVPEAGGSITIEITDPKTLLTVG
ncbi:MAG: hypothetical protein LBF88_01545 [Planctomycetaceae bacterium]|jgi:hypothetical protein|nr:hypothetical protein [Planctomycetaceae bacterium]